jgi:sigma-54 dependent transcriptional regulator, acetoin dehydrogenase operon transcriptional activator AcoR
MPRTNTHEQQDDGHQNGVEVCGIPREHLRQLQESWTRYIDEETVDAQLVRREVADSWQRCRSFRIDPFRPTGGSGNSLHLRERLQKKQHLIRVAQPFMDDLYKLVKGSGFQVVLTDEFGFLLQVVGDPGIILRTKQVELCPGGDWSEEIKGTNAIGTAIAANRPVQIYAWEHYCQPHHFLTCSAAPVHDPDGAVAGVLDVSGDYHVANPHTIAMVVAAVHAIENELRLQRATTNFYIAYHLSNFLRENMSDGLISMDPKGFVTELNLQGAKILGVNPDTIKGRHFSNLCNSREALAHVLANPVDQHVKDITIEKTGKKISSNSSLLRDDAGSIVGTVTLFREINGRHLSSSAPCCESNYTFDDIVGDSPSMRASKEWARRAALSPSTVLIKGETGTGKELFAQAIHNASPRKHHRFVALNCAALPEYLIESELFGYEEGAFTGARRGGQPGKFELANLGTIFLDEVGDMPPSVQMKLLRVIQEKRVSRIGSAQDRQIDIRIIAATNRDLSIEVKRAHFREDLYYRLNVLKIQIPALRDRKEDLPTLVKYLTEKIGAKLNTGGFQIQEDFMKGIQAHNWPGNIRELENVIESGIIQAGEDHMLTGELLTQLIEQPPNTRSNLQPVKALKEVEKDLISEALMLYKGNIRKVAAKLGICRNTLYRKMREYNINIS